MSKIFWSSMAAALAITGAADAAAVLGAKTIRVTNANGDWLQVGEVQALQDLTGINVALATNGATATGSGNYDTPANPSNAIDGVAPVGYPHIYHADSPGFGEFLEISLAATYNLSSLTIFGRADIFGERDIYNVEIFNASGASIFTGTLDNRALAGGGNTLAFGTAGPGVPEPTTWAMMILGLGGVGAILRRRNAHLPA
ncbi:PEPxxWA-CTERM sorting domain-containing protein [Phenylobacterium sp.]|uniref:PEPxxWA-CTERM sorting domain-containing protein n=1 Tax=Phenylobacterium sp. TaxID=1871053 RepID=UPI003D28B1FD